MEGRKYKGWHQFEKNLQLLFENAKQVSTKRW